MEAFGKEREDLLKNFLEFPNGRKHWSVENQLHWCLDVIYNEGRAKNRKDNSPLNMNVLRKIALSLVTEAQYGRWNKRKMMFKAALNPNVLLNIILGHKK